jgi:hypothetical protein
MARRATESFGRAGSKRPDDDIVVADLGDPNRGRIDPSRMGRPRDPNDPEPYPIVTAEDRAETLRPIALDKKRRMRAAE